MFIFLVKKFVFTLYKIENVQIYFIFCEHMSNIYRIYQNYIKITTS